MAKKKEKFEDALQKLETIVARMEEGGKLKDDEKWRRLKEKLLKVSVVERQLRPAAYWLDLAERSTTQEER